MQVCRAGRELGCGKCVVQNLLFAEVEVLTQTEKSWRETHFVKDLQGHGCRERGVPRHILLGLFLDVFAWAQVGLYFVKVLLLGISEDGRGQWEGSSDWVVE